MARMIPPAPGVGHADDTEELVFELIRDGTPDSWVGLHHVGLPRHESKPIAEVDFVIVSPAGIFCLEVKGGAARRENGYWYAGSRQLSESPFLQVGSAMAALRKTTEELHPFVFGYGCVFPHCVFDVKGPEVLPEVVFDADSIEEGFQKYVERMGDFWSAKYPHAKRLDPNEVRRAVDVLRPDFTTVESVLHRVRESKRRLVEYTAQQARAVEGLRENRQVVVKGGAGTGKTLIAAHEAVRLAEAGSNVLLTCFNKALAKHLQVAIRDSNLRVSHIDELISELIAAGGTHDQIPSDVSDDEAFALYRPLAAIEGASRLDREAEFDAIVIDEGQDLLTQGRVDVLDCLLQGGIKDGLWRVFWDPQQALFSDGASASLRLLTSGGGDPTLYPLDVNCRNTRPIADRVECLSGVSAGEIAFVDGPDAVDREWDGARTHEKALRAAVKSWRDQGVPLESMVVLSPRRFGKSLANRDLGIGVPVRDFSGAPHPEDPSSLAFATIQSFKGLECDAVILVDVDDLESERMRSLLYVAASRARTLLCSIRHKETTSTFARRVADLALTRTKSENSVIEIL
jgi:hypothetical protein